MSLSLSLIDPPPETDTQVISVSMLMQRARKRLESGFPLQWIAGEISNLTVASSGHVYFSLKDTEAQVRCVMFRNRAQLLGFQVQNGQRVEIRALVTLYEPRGDFQLNVDSLRKAGQGKLHEAFLTLKNKLLQEGLFSEERKRSLPRYPSTIGVITSPNAAALHDVIACIRRRAPHLHVIIYPCLVQGEAAPQSIINALFLANQRKECDALILCRGGGSLEDLWAFNNEALARELHKSEIPIVTGIGHETDTSIADFVADYRATTPTGAAEHLAPDRAHLYAALASLEETMSTALRRKLERLSQQLDFLSHRIIHPQARISAQRETLSMLYGRMHRASLHRHAQARHTLLRQHERLATVGLNIPMQRQALMALRDRYWQGLRGNQERREATLLRCEKALRHLNPENVLARGYALIRDERGGLISSREAMEPNAVITVSLRDGSVRARVIAPESAH